MSASPIIFDLGIFEQEFPLFIGPNQEEAYDFKAAASSDENDDFEVDKECHDKVTSIFRDDDQQPIVDNQQQEGATVSHDNHTAQISSSSVGDDDDDIFLKEDDIFSHDSSTAQISSSNTNSGIGNECNTETGYESLAFQVSNLPDCTTGSSQNTLQCATISMEDNRKSSSRFDTSAQVKKGRRKHSPKKLAEQKEEEKQVKKVVETQENPTLKWEHTKICSKNTYLEIDIGEREFSLSIEVFQTGTGSHGPLEELKEHIQKVSDLSITIQNLNTTEKNYISLQDHLPKATCKERKKTTWIKLGGGDYLFLCCDGHKFENAHNFISINNQGIRTRNQNLNQYSKKCKKDATRLIISSDLSELNTLKKQ
ncbi:predicted protein [Naegleria gruberi]|uniref:Predicted protein n=1 Tax=Naegleria gruberi TaxID=5762 RepID=D2V1Z5_NAEGR|nr:uncharacterized protein NAEGRDRAFT_62748 [Naegleria gruberi]EFC49247.1 predicted protein [Naegleria gruberi]|eukprot:XP_002681991.1 predicted protein [Naegleria gruberi strain NEG-M]